MGNMIEGDVYRCEECNLELKVTKPCNEEDCDLVCCSKQMKKIGQLARICSVPALCSQLALCYAYITCHELLGRVIDSHHDQKY